MKSDGENSKEWLESYYVSKSLWAMSNDDYHLSRPLFFLLWKLGVRPSE